MRIFLYIFIFLLIFSSATFAKDIAVIVNKNNSVEKLSLVELDRIFRKEIKQWPDGTKIFPINREYGTQIRSTFSIIVHKESPEKMKRFWLEQQFKGIRPPITQASSVAVKRMVANVPGAIGYIYLQEVDNTVKVLEIDGSKPGEQEYKLKE